MVNNTYRGIHILLSHKKRIKTHSVTRQKAHIRIMQRIQNASNARCKWYSNLRIKLRNPCGNVNAYQLNTNAPSRIIKCMCDMEHPILLRHIETHTCISMLRRWRRATWVRWFHHELMNWMPIDGLRKHPARNVSAHIMWCVCINVNNGILGEPLNVHIWFVRKFWVNHIWLAWSLRYFRKMP